MSALAPSTAVVQDQDGSDLLNLVGVPEFNRRLTDKILAAFNHAYSVGETAIAAQLRAVLAECEARCGPSGADRRASRALARADLWIEFVRARDAYRAAARQQPGADPVTVAGSLHAMKEAYRRWSAS